AAVMALASGPLGRLVAGDALVPVIDGARAISWLPGSAAGLDHAARILVGVELACLVGLVVLPRMGFRLIVGGLFVAGALLRADLSGTPTPAWLPLTLVFVDWDRLLDWTADRLTRERAPSPPQVPYHNRTATTFIALFLAVEVALILAPLAG